MAFSGFVVILCVSVGYVCSIGVPRPEGRMFPEKFLFGAASASYQVEGGWNADGKSESIWDHFTHSQSALIKDNSNGDIADDSYHLYERDVQMLRELGVDFYRFSLSWTRILPTGFPDYINNAGVQYYNNLINELLKHKIQPMVTIFHWDLPQKLQDLGGWANPDIVTWFSDYARTAFTLFGDRVKYFITINEPTSICYYSYGRTTLAPGVNIKGIADYMCAKNVLVAHARAYHIYDKEFRLIHNGNIFIALSTMWYEPVSENDQEAVLDTIQFYWAQYAWPIFSETGDFPPSMKKRIAARSAEQGFPRSRLPDLTPEEVELIKGSSDYLGVNHYTSFYVYRNSSVPVYDKPSFDDDLGVALYQLKEWQIGASDYQVSRYTPWGFLKLLKYIKLNFKNTPVFITENGFSSYGGLKDDDRVKYFRGYLEEVLNALDDGCDVRGYTAWSLMDNFEWGSGYTYSQKRVTVSYYGVVVWNPVDERIQQAFDKERFGLYEVNFDSKNLTRTARKSAYVYKEIVRTRRLDHHYVPDITAPITIDPAH